MTEEFLAISSLQQLEATPAIGEGPASYDESFRGGKIMVIAFNRSYTAVAGPVEYHLLMNFAQSWCRCRSHGCCHPSRGCFKLDGLPSCGEEAKMDVTRSCPFCQEGCAQQVASAVQQKEGRLLI